MAEVIYHGPHTGVTVKTPYGGPITAENGEVTQVPDAMVEGLLQQPANWRLAVADTTNLTVAELKEHAYTLDIDGYKSMNKSELLSAIEADGQDDDTEDETDDE